MDLPDHALIMLEMSAGDKTSASGISAFRFYCARFFFCATQAPLFAKPVAGMADSGRVSVGDASDSENGMEQHVAYRFEILRLGAL